MQEKIEIKSQNDTETDATRYLMMDHGGVLDGSIIQDKDSISPNDLVLMPFEWGGYQVLINGVHIVNDLNYLIDNHGYKLVFHSKNRYDDQIEILKQLQEACRNKNITFPSVHAMGVYDAVKYPDISSNEPNIYSDDHNILVSAWGVDDLNGKASLRRALESSLSISEAQRSRHIVFDDGRPNVDTPRREGYQAHLIGGDDGVSLSEAIKAVRGLSTPRPSFNPSDLITEAQRSRHIVFDDGRTNEDTPRHLTGEDDGVSLTEAAKAVRMHSTPRPSFNPSYLECLCVGMAAIGIGTAVMGGALFAIGALGLVTVGLTALTGGAAFPVLLAGIIATAPSIFPAAMLVAGSGITAIAGSLTAIGGGMTAVGTVGFFAANAHRHKQERKLANKDNDFVVDTPNNTNNGEGDLILHESDSDFDASDIDGGGNRCS